MENQQISAFIDEIRNRYGEERFTSGQCHDLAAVLAERFDGLLTALVRRSQDGLMVTYSHMVVDIEGVYWDINGPEADDRWIALRDPLDEGDNEWEYVAMGPEALVPFLQEYGATPDPDLIAELNAIWAQAAADLAPGP